MKNRHSILLTCFGLACLGLTLPGVAMAQSGGDDDDDITFEPDDVSQPKPEPEGDAPEPEPDVPDVEPEPDVEVDSSAGGKPVKADAKLGEERQSWKNIVVVIRKPFLKMKRVELVPMAGVTMNDNIIRHFQLGGQLNYFLTDILAIGLEGYVYQGETRAPFELVATQARRLPTVNEYKYGAALNFHYVPVYGKFAVLNKKLIHWEAFFTAGVGVTRSEVIERNPAFRGFSNTLITPNVGVSMRFFLTKYLTLSLGFRDYLFIDKFEPTNRSPVMNATPEEAKENADSAFINNVVFQAGLSIWFPLSFEYTTHR